MLGYLERMYSGSTNKFKEKIIIMNNQKKKKVVYKYVHTFMPGSVSLHTKFIVQHDEVVFFSQDLSLA